MRDLKNKIMRDGINAGVFSQDKEVYIVGGYLRDVLLGKKSNDIDYIVRGDIKDFACNLLVNERGKTKERKLLDGAAIVELKKEQMIRIVLKSGSTLDFTELKGALEANLKERDFTMNALAWSPREGLVDLLNGVRDIREKRIRAVSITNFKNDPLRLLRVYRFISELGWKAEQRTREMVKALKKEIKKPAAERVTVEFFRLLVSKNYRNALDMALADGLLEQFLSVPRRKLSENIKSLALLESRIKKMPSMYKSALQSAFSQELTLIGLLRLEKALEGSLLSENRLSLSRQIRERLAVVYELQAESEKHDIFAEDRTFDTFVKAKDAMCDFLVLSGNAGFMRRHERFKKIWKESFLTSGDIMGITGLKQGITLGKIIYDLKKMQFEGKLKTKKDAVKWLKQNYE